MKASKVEVINLELSFDEYAMINIVLNMFVDCDLNEKLTGTYIPFEDHEIERVSGVAKQLLDIKRSLGFTAIGDEA